MILIEFADNYADEFDVNGFFLLENMNEWLEFKLILSQYTNKIEWGFGSNEYIDYYNGKDLLEKYCNVIELTDIEVEALCKALSSTKRDLINYGYGMVPTALNILEYIDEKDFA